MSEDNKVVNTLKAEETETAKTDVIGLTEASTDGESIAEKPKKKSFWSENKVEVITAILLGVTAMLTAWATWIGSLHSGIQAIN